MRTSPDLIARAMRVPRSAKTGAAEADGSKAKPEGIDRDTFVASLASRRDAAASSLTQAKTLRQKGLDQAIETALEALRKRVTGKPELVPGAVIVRVIGVRREGDAAQRVPLAGLTVRLGVNENEGIETETDALGIAALDPQSAAKPTDDTQSPTKPTGEPSELQILAPDRTVLNRRRLTPKDLKGLAVVIEVAEAQPLAAAFAAGERWSKAEDAAAERAKEVRSLAAAALPRLETELKAMKDGLGRAIAVASKTKDCAGQAPPDKQ